MDAVETDKAIARAAEVARGAAQIQADVTRHRARAALGHVATERQRAGWRSR